MNLCSFLISNPLINLFKFAQSEVAFLLTVEKKRPPFTLVRKEIGCFKYNLFIHQHYIRITKLSIDTTKHIN
jgi:hypothetical protein